MSPLTRALLGAALTLPLVAFVAGTLSTGPEGPARPRPVILQDDGSAENPPLRDDRPRRDRPDDDRRDDGRRGDDADDRIGDNARDREDEDDDDDDDPEVVLPPPTQLDDHEDDGGDDDSASGDDGGEDD